MSTFYNKKFLTTLFAVIVIVLAVLLIKNNNASANAFEKYQEVDAGSMLNLSTENIKKAKMTYLNKNLSVTGRIGYIDYDGKCVYLYQLEEGSMVNGIQFFAELDNKVFSDSKIGDTVTVNGHVDEVGTTMHYIMSENK